jgi:hypothetical protein
MVTWTHFSVVLYVHCLSCYVNTSLRIHWFTLEFELWCSYVFVELISQTSFVPNCVVCDAWDNHRNKVWTLSCSQFNFLGWILWEQVHLLIPVLLPDINGASWSAHFSFFSSYFMRLAGDWFVWESLFAIKEICWIRSGRHRACFPDTGFQSYKSLVIDFSLAHMNYNPATLIVV